MNGYGALLQVLVKSLARFKPRVEIFSDSGIPVGHWNNVVNRNKVSSSGNPYYCPTEWGVALTRASGDYSWLKKVAWDCGALILTPDDVETIVKAQMDAAMRRSA